MPFLPNAGNTPMLNQHHCIGFKVKVNLWSMPIGIPLLFKENFCVKNPALRKLWTLCNSALPMLTSPLWTVDWFTKTDFFFIGNQAIYPKTQANIKTQKLFKCSKKGALIFAILAICYLTKRLQSM